MRHWPQDTELLYCGSFIATKVCTPVVHSAPRLLAKSAPNPQLAASSLTTLLAIVGALQHTRPAINMTHKRSQATL